ncbi:vesicle transport protein SFT2C isoform X2 [Odontomachus brunneus]|uniref:vesicle transport protein SFT2C isoform X2 n=1 Tax=Odontomachus brunneus TaxID=486640 RepID=UPI0013F2A991|nr:vesicle transport protein SFT2C isoform X2 [Odontomachus brunneus]
MADLNKELNEYLLSNKNEKQYKITMPMVAISKANFGKWFGKSANEPEGDSEWMKGLQNDYCPSMTKTQRIAAFAVCSLLGTSCWGLAMFHIPVLLLKARKFALLYSLGSLLLLMSSGFLWGPMSYTKSLFRADRRCFTVSYLTTLASTLYCALYLQSSTLAFLCAILHIIAMLSFLKFIKKRIALYKKMSIKYK